MRRLLFLALLCAGGIAAANDAAPVVYSKLVYPGRDGRLVYKPYTDRGDTIPDFSRCGYGGGGVPIPDVPARITLHPEAGENDDLPRVQAAVDQVGKLSPAGDGFRGAVLLTKGTYRLSGTLRLGVGGVVLRGAGVGDDGTVLIATGRKDHRLIEVGGNKGRELVAGSTHPVADAYVPVGARTVGVAAGHGFQVGDTVVVRRVGNAAWIRAIGMDRITPRPSDPQSTKQWQPFNVELPVQMRGLPCRSGRAAGRRFGKKRCRHCRPARCRGWSRSRPHA